MKLSLFVLLIFTALSTSVSLAENLRVGVIDIRPWGYKDKDGNIEGQHVDMFNALSQRVGISFKYSLLPLGRIKALLQSGGIDMSVIFRREGMESYVQFVGLVRPYNYYLVGKRGVLFDERNLDSIRTVGYILGEEDFVRKCFTDKYQSTARLESVSTYGSLLKMLQTDRIDAATIPSKGLKSYLDDIGADETLISGLFVICYEEAYLKFSKRSECYKPETIGKLQDGLQAMRDNGTIEAIAEKYEEINN